MPGVAVRPLLERAARFATSDESLDRLLEVGDSFVLWVDGVASAGWCQQWDAEGTLRILAYGGTAHFDLTRFLDAAIAAQGARVAQFQTRRRGLVKKTEALGWRVAGRAPNGVIMRKEFQP